MKQTGTRFYRSIATFVMVFLVTVIAMPFNQTTVAAATALSDDFNTCTLNTTFWKPEKTDLIPGATPTLSGMFSGPGKATLSITLPPGDPNNLEGTSYTFSADNTRAPRLWHTIPDGDFRYQAKFLAPLQNSENSFKIMGILVRDNTTPASPKYFRFDFNANNPGGVTNGNLNEFIGYLSYDASSVAHMNNIRAVTDLPGDNPDTGGLYLTVAYVKSTNTWTATYQVGDTSANTKVESFVTPAYAAGFTVTDIGLFVASTINRNLLPNAPAAPGAKMVVDYFADLNDPAFANPNTANDAVTLNVTTNGTGTGTVNWPTQCAPGNVVTLTAVPGPNSTFVAWGGDAAGTSPTTTVTMDASKNVTATFNKTGTGNLGFPIYLPGIFR